MQETFFLQKHLQVETTYNTGGVIVNKIIDREGAMIAKINGKDNLPVCWAMVKAYNDRQEVDRMKSLLKNRLVDIFRQLNGSSVWNVAIRAFFNEGGNLDQLIAELKSQAEDSPVVMTSILSGEAVQILNVL